MCIRDSPYACSFKDCLQTFTQVSNLRRHERTHTGEKPFNCETCHKTFSSASNLKQHQQVHVFNDTRQKYKCEECGKTYYYLSSLKKHQKDHSKSDENGESSGHSSEEPACGESVKSKRKGSYHHDHHHQHEHDHDETRSEDGRRPSSVSRIDFKKLSAVLPHTHKDNCLHLEILHKGHVDYLWEGYLVYCNPEGQLEFHQVEHSESNPENCKPINDIVSAKIEQAFDPSTTCCQPVKICAGENVNGEKTLMKTGGVINVESSNYGIISEIKEKIEERCDPGCKCNCCGDRMRDEPILNDAISNLESSLHLQNLQAAEANKTSNCSESAGVPDAPHPSVASNCGECQKEKMQTVNSTLQESIASNQAKAGNSLATSVEIGKNMAIKGANTATGLLIPLDLINQNPRLSGAPTPMNFAAWGPTPMHIPGQPPPHFESMLLDMTPFASRFDVDTEFTNYFFSKLMDARDDLATPIHNANHPANNNGNTISLPSSCNHGSQTKELQSQTKSSFANEPSEPSAKKDKKQPVTLVNKEQAPEKLSGETQPLPTMNLNELTSDFQIASDIEELGGSPACSCHEKKLVRHFHNKYCGHFIVLHNGHVDYLVDGRLHHPHDEHCDDHGPITVLTSPTTMEKLSHQSTTTNDETNKNGKSRCNGCNCSKKKKDQIKCCQLVFPQFLGKLKVQFNIRSSLHLLIHLAFICQCLQQLSLIHI
eukprot:TRINITY_DN9269_c0_g1_i5.p1 TRINITY_DN9269_c0_g1~~TRINITY_DN9269_c0_g1_i5.p1  ORF type:complete len:711 (-),score=86.42 TRINITY_DN9269_c0_g1_i5:60-2192(-)